MSLFLGCLGVCPPPTMAKMLVLWIISMIPMPAPKSRLMASSISSSNLNILNPFCVATAK